MGNGSSGKTTSVGKGQVIDIGNENTGGGEWLNLEDLKNDSRGDIQKLFVEQTGFSSIKGTDEMDTAVLGAYGNQLNALERRFGAIGASNTAVAMVDDASFIAAVSYNPADPSTQTLILNNKAMGSIGKSASTQRKGEAQGWHMPTDGSIKSVANYTVTHEYGHILHNQLYSKAVQNGYKGSRNQWIGSVARSIANNATSKYGGSQKSLSTYGATNAREFFAEAFANSQLGAPNAVGKAMNDWLKGQGF